MDDNKKRDIFYGVVAVATLIIALVGATLAYFSISVHSEEGAVNATAAVVSIEYMDGQNVIAQASNLIPASLNAVKAVYEHNLTAINNQTAPTSDEDDWDNLCVDSNGMEVCSVYRFSLKSDQPRTATATLRSEHNGFTYLAYALRDVTNSMWLSLDSQSHQYVSLTKCDNNDDDSTQRCYNVDDQTGDRTYTTIAKNSIFGLNNELQYVRKNIGTTKQEYDLVIFILENDDEQNIDQGKQFQGTIIVDVIDEGAGRVTGEADWS